ncbi:MAG TPA: hypothetical protein VI112_13280 [Bacteroidia bacterium]|jgi:hypothetical protein
MRKELLLFFFLLFRSLVFAQDADSIKTGDKRIYRVETVDGIKFTGILIREEEEWVLFQTRSLGEVSVLRSRIKRLRRLEPGELRNGEYWGADPACTHYLLSPSALCLKKGEGYYYNFYLAIHGCDVGLSGHFSVGGGADILAPVFERSRPGLFYLRGRYCFLARPEFNVAAGAMYLNSRVSLGDAAGSENLLGFALVTAGNKDNNLSLGLGWGYRSTFFEDPFNRSVRTDTRFMQKPVITFSAISRVGRHCSLMMENWIFPVRNERINYFDRYMTLSYDYYFVFTYGIRFFTERFSVDAGLLNNSEIIRHLPTGIPYVGMSLKFGGKKVPDDRDWEFPVKH